MSERPEAPEEDRHSDPYLVDARRIADQCLCFRARRVSRLLTRLYDEAFRPLEIQATQVTVLSAVSLISTHGGGMSRLAEVLAMDATTVSRTVGTLEASGLVKVHPSPDDARVRQPVLTEEGERVLEEAVPLWEEAHARVVDALGPEVAAALRDQLDAVVSSVGETARERLLGAAMPREAAAAGEE